MNQTLRHSNPKFLIIRRDNIGDLVCTTPIFSALRARFPQAYIAALVNSYNLPVLENNREIDELFAYTKAKHRPRGKTTLGVYWDRLRLLARLRKTGFDYVILAAPGFQPRSLALARLLKPKHVIGFVEGEKRHRRIDIAIPHTLPAPLQEAEDVFRLLAPLGIQGAPPAARVVPDPMETSRTQQILQRQAWWRPGAPLIGIHISARKPSQRWPVEYFAELVRTLHRNHAATFMLFWSPGDDANPLHPGDDAKARQLMDALPGIPILACPTRHLSELIGGLALCEKVICSDGGAMHLAAGLGKPILCFFGKSSATHWHPWGVPHVLIQPPSLDVADISVSDALAGFEKLQAGFEVNSPERNS